MAWLILLVAGLLEVIWAYAMKISHGFTRILPTFVTVSAMILSFWLLAIAMRSLPLGTAYSVWTGIGALGAFLVGVFFLGESIHPLRLVAALMIIGGVVLMSLAPSSTH